MSAATPMLFAEHAPAPVWIRACGIVSLVTLVVIIMITALFAGQVFGSAGLIVAVVSSGLGVAFAAVVCLTTAIDIVVTEHEVVLRLLPFPAKRIERSDIVAAAPDMLSPLRNGGLGWRVNGKDRYLLLSGGTGVSIQRMDGRCVHVRTDRPDAMITALRETVSAGSA